MRNTELVKILTFIANAYPQKFIYPKESEEKTEIFERTWYTFLKNYTYKITIVGVKKLILNKPTWPPTIGELVREIERLRSPEEDRLLGGEAWELVLGAIHQYGSDEYGTEIAMGSLPSKVRRAVECVGGLRIIGLSYETNTYMMNKFIEIYEQISERDEKQKILPDELKREIEELKQPYLLRKEK